MNSESELIKALISEAKDAAEQIIKNAELEIQNTLEEEKRVVKQRAKKKVDEIKAKAENDAVILRIRKLLLAKNEVSWMILKKKHEIVKKVLDESKSKINKLMQEESYQTILEGHIVNGAIILDNDELEIVLNQIDSDLPINLASLTEKIYKISGKKIKLNKSNVVSNTLGGVIIQTFDKKLVLNNTFDYIMANSDKEILLGINKTLFKTENGGNNKLQLP